MNGTNNIQNFAYITPSNYKEIYKNSHQTNDIYSVFGDTLVKDLQSVQLMVFSKVPVLKIQLTTKNIENIKIDKCGLYTINGFNDSFIFDTKKLNIRSASAFEHQNSYNLTCGYSTSKFANQKSVIKFFKDHFKFEPLLITNPEELFRIIISQVRSTPKNLLMCTLYGQGAKGRLKGLREIILANKDKIRASLKFKNSEGDVCCLLNYPYLGFTETSLEALAAAIDNVIQHEFPEVVSLLTMTKTVGELCYLNQKPILYFHFSPLGGFIFSYHINTLVERKINKKRTVIYLDDEFVFNKYLIYKQLPNLGWLTLLKSIAAPANANHHIDVGLIIELAKLEQVYTLHDAAGLLPSYIPLARALYVGALDKLQNSNAFDKFFVSNLNFLCPNIKKILKKINESHIEFKNIKFKLLDEKKKQPFGAAKVTDCEIDFKIDGATILGEILSISVDKTEFQLPEGLQVNCLGGIFEGYSVNNKSIPKLQEQITKKSKQVDSNKISSIALDKYVVNLLNKLEKFFLEYRNFTINFKKQRKLLNLNGPGLG